MTISFFLSFCTLPLFLFQLFYPFCCFLDETWISKTLFFLEKMISLHPQRNNFSSLTVKLSPVNFLIKLWVKLQMQGKDHQVIVRELLNKHNIFSVKTMFSQNFLLWAASFKKRVLKMSQITNAGKKTSKLCKAEQVTLLTVTVRPISNTTVLNIFFFNKRFYSVKYLFLSLTLQAV